MAAGEEGRRRPMTQAEKDGLAEAINRGSAGAERYRPYYVFAHGVLLPVGLLCSVAGLLAGFLWGLWPLLVLGLVLAFLGFAIQVGVMRTIRESTDAAANVYMSDLERQRAAEAEQPDGPEDLN